MSSFLRVSVIAGATLLSGCASWMPTWDLGSTFSRNTDVSLTIESDPPGADARTSAGPGCRTPCMIPVPGDRELTVTYTLNGYLSQTVTVRPRERGSFDFGSPELTPNPVSARLEPAPPPPPIKHRPRPKKRKAAPRPAAPPGAPAAPSAAPPPNPAIK
jgi:hypothetical protein